MVGVEVKQRKTHAGMDHETSLVRTAYSIFSDWGRKTRIPRGFPGINTSLNPLLYDFHAVTAPDGCPILQIARQGELYV